MKTLADIERYLGTHNLELRVRRVARWRATLTDLGRRFGGEEGVWEMEGDDLVSAVNAAIDARGAMLGSRGKPS